MTKEEVFCIFVFPDQPLVNNVPALFHQHFTAPHCISLYFCFITLQKFFKHFNAFLVSSDIYSWTPGETQFKKNKQIM